MTSTQKIIVQTLQCAEEILYILDFQVIIIVELNVTAVIFVLTNVTVQGVRV